jgi:hypothetical protein
MMKKAVSIGLALALIFVLAACGGAAATTAPSGGGDAATPTGETGGGDGGDPAAAARTFIEAGYTGDTEAYQSAVCAAFPTDYELTPIQLPEGAELDLSGLVYTVANQTDTTAEVTVSGVIRFNITAGGQTTTQEVPYTEITLQMTNEDGWRVCGTAAP